MYYFPVTLLPLITFQLLQTKQETQYMSTRLLVALLAARATATGQSSIYGSLHIICLMEETSVQEASRALGTLGSCLYLGEGKPHGSRV